MNRELLRHVMDLVARRDQGFRSDVARVAQELKTFGEAIIWANQQSAQFRLDMLATQMRMVIAYMRGKGYEITCPFSVYEVEEFRQMVGPIIIVGSGTETTEDDNE